MPIFEYRCRDCGAQFEKILNAGAPAVRCASCESPNVEKLLSLFAVAGSAPADAEPGPCPCGAPRRGMCGE